MKGNRGNWWVGEVGVGGRETGEEGGGSRRGKGVRG